MGTTLNTRLHWPILLGVGLLHAGLAMFVLSAQPVDMRARLLPQPRISGSLVSKLDKPAAKPVDTPAHPVKPAQALSKGPPPAKAQPALSPQPPGPPSDRAPVASPPAVPVTIATASPLASGAVAETPKAQASTNTSAPNSPAPTKSSGGSDEPPAILEEATPVYSPQPDYPAMSRRLREEGRVNLVIQVLPNGTVGEVRIRQSSGFPRIDQSGRNAIKTWRFAPAQRDGKPVAHWYTVSVDYTLTQ
jgi:protein TonB